MTTAVVGAPAVNAGALDGVTVLDLTRVLAGPWCTQLLADYGADVLKVERPGGGDDTRGWGPPYVRAADGSATRDSAYFASANRGKRRVELDLASEAGQAEVRRLAAAADVLVENFKPGGLASYGLDVEALCAANPRLIACSITGFGQTGPRRDEPGYDVMVQGQSGLMSLTGEAEGQPLKFGIPIVDLMTGMYATTAILAALEARRRTGVGQRIDLALFDVGLAMLANQGANYLIGGREPVRHGNAHPNVVPYQAFATSDGHVIVAVGNDAQFARACAALALPVLASDPRFATNSLRIANRTALLPVMEARLREGTTADWIARLGTAGVPCGPINTVATALSDAQAAAREMVMRVPHASAGEIALIANPVKFSATPVRRDRGLPA